MRKKVALAVIIALWTAAPVYSQTAPTTDQPTIEQQIQTVIAGATIAIQQGQLDLAQKMLQAVLDNRPDDTEALFLMGTIAQQRQRWSDAIAILQRILEKQPNLIRVRLELARSYFEAGDDFNANYNFRLVLPQVPEVVSNNIYLFLNQIEARKRFTYNLAFSASADTNINAAAATNQLTLFGLPFNLSEGAVQKSGFGIIVNAAGEYRQPLTPNWRLRAGATLYRASYIGHSQFDDMIARAYAGPQYLFYKGDMSLLAVGTERWFGNNPYSWSYGPRIEFNYSVTDRIAISVGVEYTPDWYHIARFQNGHLITGLVTTSYALTPTSFLSLITGVSKEHTASPDYSNLAYRIGIAYQRELPENISLYIQPDAILSDYVAPSPAFGTTRRDRLVRLQLSVAKRDWSLQGFIPSFTYNFADDLSNQQLFAFQRHQFLIGLTRTF